MQGYAELSAVLADPAVQRRLLAVDQPRAELLVGHQPFVGHGADRLEVVLAGQVHVAGADEAPGEVALEDMHHFLLGAVGEAPAGAEVGDLEFREFLAAGLGGEPVELAIELLADLFQDHLAVAITVAHLADDGQQRHLEEDHVQPWAAQADCQLAILDAGVHVAQVEAEQAEEADEVRLHERDAFEEGELVGGYLDFGEALDLVADLRQVRTQVLGVAAAEFPLHFGVGVVVQHRLHHGQLVEIGIEQVLHDALGKDAFGHVHFSLSAPARALSSRSRSAQRITPASRISSQARCAVSSAMARQAGR